MCPLYLYGEACSHVAAVLFLLEANSQLKRETSCASQPCYWLPPAFKTVPFARISDTNLKGEFSEFIHNQITYDLPSKECMTCRCLACADSVLQFSPRVTHPVSFQQWQTADGRAEKITIQGTTEDAFQKLKEQSQHFLLHSYVKRKQATSFKKLTESCDNKNIVIQVHCSENATIAAQREIQSATGVTHKLRYLLFTHGLVVWMKKGWSSFQMTWITPQRVYMCACKRCSLTWEASTLRLGMFSTCTPGKRTWLHKSHGTSLQRRMGKE